MQPPPPPSSSSIVPVQPSSSRLAPSDQELSSAMTKLKKPSAQHIVGFEERYQQALRMQQNEDEHSAHFNRRFFFDVESREWTRFNMSHYPKMMKEMKSFPDQLKIVSLNVWFANILQNKRYEAQLDFFEQVNPDIICLQEMIPNYIENNLLKRDFVRNNYIISDIDGTSVDPYGVMVLVKRSLPILDIRITSLTTRMGRKFIHVAFAKEPITDITLMEKYFASASKGAYISQLETMIPCFAVIGTVHLESLASKSSRKTQLEQIHPVLEHYSSSSLRMLMGDFNFDSESKENENLTSGIFKDYTDVWYSLYPQHVIEGKTFPYGPHRKGDRLDRMMIKSTIFLPQKMEVFGKQPLPLSSEEQTMLREKFHMEKVCLSDHYGIYCELQHC
ncbi:hypothetical protein C9374_003131 [Naegleria lovaniensis]|uniref:Endonuclease/exonuclease/phosphatase domain-containing protein n=1 Tax=Naegleria lovaniensis TaxID=51637 RepID=A0AA88GS14_NAELO|nr:uncharacterized protein C9374_003131 [Naegleria lovaniensis]KAG2385982.1 hypothetical protein C9374_003131 [Naegleria lovaniensis]